MSNRQGNFVFVGGTQGIGKAAALAVAATGSSVLLIGRNKAAGDAAVSEALAAGAAEAKYLSADISTIAGMKAAADGILAWKPEIHGLLHSAMSAFSEKQMTADGLEFAFALQYLARCAINRRCLPALEASGDGRIVHVAGAVSYNMARPNLDDLQFEKSKWSFFKSILSTHVEGFMFLDEASRQWASKPVSLYAACVGTTKTQSMRDPAMPFIMRLMGRFGVSPDESARNCIRLLLDSKPLPPRAGILKNSKKYEIAQFGVPQQESARLWQITGKLLGE